MITTCFGEHHRSVKTLKKGDIFKTNRQGRLPGWSPWFKAIENPVYRTYLSPKKRKRWGLRAELF